MRTFLAYYFRLLKTAFGSDSWGYVDLAVGLVGLTVVGIAYFLPELTLGDRLTAEFGAASEWRYPARATDLLAYVRQA